METPQDKKLVADPKRSKMVKIKALRQIRLLDGTNMTTGEVKEVSEADAVEFCDQKIDNSYTFSGYRSDRDPDTKLGKIVRAERV